MRGGGLSAIQQTLTPEAASVLTHSIAEAGRRNHGQTTPLHVAASLLSSPTGFLRQACIRSHPNSSHPLQCRALELCFSVALERLPTAAPQSSGPGEPPISNALMAALKRAQAHQRRGCPENQQQPLLAVKVELEQLIISILDDPSVSRVMREASFSSPAVKAAIEQGLNCRASSGPGSKFGLGFRPGPAPLGGGGGGGERNLYLNPRLQQQQQHGSVGLQGRGEDVRRVMDILSRHKKRNPVLVGEYEPQEVVREVLKNVEIRDGVLKNVEVVSIEKELGLDYRSQMPAKLNELGGLIERKMVVNSRGGNGVILDLGDLKWLVDQPSNQGALEAARGAVSEMGKIVRKFGEGSKIWLIGTATCETYLRCQVYHPTMENEWDLQVVSIVARPSIHGMLPRLGSNGGILSNSIECLSPMKNFPMGGSPLTRRVSENLDPSGRVRCCLQCTENCNQEVVKLKAEQAAKSPQSDAVSDKLPPWLQNAKVQANDDLQAKNQDLILRQKTQELHKKWSEKCLELHPNFHQNASSERITQSPLSMTGLYNLNLLGRQPLQQKLQQPRTLSDALQLNISPAQRPNPDSPPGSPVRTDLILGPTKSQSVQDKAHEERVKDFLGCISSESQNKLQAGDVDSFKRLLKGLMEKVWWQRQAASSLASAITQCKLGNGKRRGGGSRGDVWLLFSGPDRTGKRKMASALSELVCGVKPIVISLGTKRYGDESSDLNFRGKTAIDRIAEGVRRNPFSVIVLQDIDEADLVVRSSIKRAMERGRLADSHGREIGLGNAIFVITSSWVPHQQHEGLSGGGLSEERMTSLASGGWQLRISIMGEKTTGKSKRPPPSWLLDHNDDDGDNDDRDRSTKQRKEIGSGISFDLNRIAENEDDRLDGSNNSSDLTVDHEDEHVQENRGSPTSSTSYELFDCVDEAITFKPVDFTPVRQNIERTITTKFSTILGETVSLKIENEALERILSGTWLGQTTLETWVDKVLGPSILQLKMNLPSLLPHSPEGKMIARLELDKESESRGQGDWLPGKISVVADAQ